MYVTIIIFTSLLLHVCHYYLGSNELKPANLNKKRESVISTAATMRVLNVLRHWVSKHSQVRHNGTCTCYNIYSHCQQYWYFTVEKLSPENLC